MLLLTFAIVAGAVAAQSPADEVSLFEATNDGVSVEYRVPRVKLESMQEWNPQTTDPVLSPRQAARLAANHLRPGQPDKVAVIAVNLTGVGTKRGLRCFYVVTGYDLDKTRGGVPPPTHDVVVLMDGSIAQPVPLKKTANDESS